MRIYGIYACALTHSKFDHSRHQRITLLFIIRILNSKYLNDDDDEGERGSKHTHKHTHTTQERRHLPFSNSIGTKREKEGGEEEENNLHKALSNREKKKSGYFDKNLVELVKKRKKIEKESIRGREISFFSMYIRLK